MASLLSEQFNIDALTTFKNSAENGTSTVINGGAIKVKRSAGLNNTFIGGFFGNIGTRSDSGQETIYAIVDLIDSTSSIDISAVDTDGNDISIGGLGGDQLVGRASNVSQLNAVNSSYNGKVERGE